MPLLSIRNLCYKYGEKTVLNDISLDVTVGDFIGILGPNGSGKTTLLKCISGVIKPSSGRIILDNRPLQELSPREVARSIAVVSQGIGAGVEFSVSDFVMLGRTPHLQPFRGETRQDMRIAREAMELTGTLGLADRNFRQLSGGEKQRVIIAQALAQEPRLLLLDEPASYLDISHEIEIFDLIKDLNRRQQMAVIVVLHDLNMASRYCHSLVLLHHGTVFARGTASEVLTPENIREVYGAEVEVWRSNGKEIIVPLIV